GINLIPWALKIQQEPRTSLSPAGREKQERQFLKIIYQQKKEEKKEETIASE
ncbi:hypothetical protein K0M31_009151, partial [Melipona bicolor]